MNRQVQAQDPRILTLEELAAILGRQEGDTEGLDYILRLWNLAAQPMSMEDIRGIARGRLSEDLCDLEVSLDDSSTAASTMAGAEGEKDTWATTVNDLYRSEAHVANSWTIFVHDRNHQAGDTVWFRVWKNGSKDFLEFEDTEILVYIREIIKRVPRSCFYFKKVGSDGHEYVSLIESNLIVRALTAILERAMRLNGIAIPKKEKKQAPLRKEKRGFLALLRFGAMGRSAGN